MKYAFIKINMEVNSMKLCKKIFAMLLVLACCLSVFALPASAAYNRKNNHYILHTIDKISRYVKNSCSETP